MLPDDVLLEIFDFYVDEEQNETEWITLAHVCRSWRSVVFQSPRRLNLRLVCTYKTPTRDILDIWPPFPLIIRDFGNYFDDGPASLDNIIAALEHNDRVCQIDMAYATGLNYVTNSTAMHKPFPELTDLRLSTDLCPILPDAFLGGTTPRLRSLALFGVPFPRLPKLLLSTTHLVKLDLHNIPHSGYIPSGVMATSLSALNSLEFLRLSFRYARPLESPPPPPPTRYTLPSLTIIRFKGTSKYLEEILAWIDAPRLDELDVTFFSQIIFNTPQLFQLISRRPTLRALERAHIAFDSESAIVRFRSQTSDDLLSVRILCNGSERQLSSLQQVCTSSFPFLSTLEDLYVYNFRTWLLRWQGDVENTLWLDLLRSFVAVKNLYLLVGSVPRIAPALQELVGGRTTDILPTLKNIFLEGFQPSGPLHEGIEKFAAARRLTSYPVAVSRWDTAGNNRDTGIYVW
jgi:hypothetical protein